jgi:hypothetical protein
LVHRTQHSNPPKVSPKVKTCASEENEPSEWSSFFSKEAQLKAYEILRTNHVLSTAISRTMFLPVFGQALHALQAHQTLEKENTGE